MTCPRCNTQLVPRDGADVGGLPGVRYLACPACGYAIGRPVVPALTTGLAIKEKVTR